MGKARRIATTRMPESERLNPAEVAALHVGPGGRVAIGAPVMTLVAPRGERIVRASRAGRVMPLVGIGDRVSAGQALFEIEADATARPRRGGTRSSGRRAARPGGAEGWRNPVLAIGVYAAACLAVLPALGAVGGGAPAWQRGALIVGATLFAIAAFRLYAPRRRGWARGAVGLVAASWVGAVGLVALHPAKVERPVPAASAGSVATLLPSDARALPTPAPLVFPADVAEPTLRPTSPGERAPVHAGSADRLAAWGGAPPAAHDATARPSPRQEPGTRAGERPDPAAADRPLAAPEPLAGVAAAWPLPLWRPAAVSASATTLPAAALNSVSRPAAAPAATGSAHDNRAGAAEVAPMVLKTAFVSSAAPAMFVPARLDQVSAAAGAQAAAMIVAAGDASGAEPGADEGVLAQDSLPPEGVRVISTSRDEAPAPEEQEAAASEPAADAAPTGPIFRAAPGSGLEDRVVRTLRLAPAEAAPEAEEAASAAADAPAPEPAAPVSRFRKPGETHTIPAPD